MRQAFFLLFIAVFFLSAHVDAQSPDTAKSNNKSPVSKDSVPVAKLPDTAKSYNKPRISTDSVPVAQSPDQKLENEDSIYAGKKMSQKARDSIAKRLRDNPRRATIYSAILPGAGQVYNKKYWKVPLVYAGVGIPAYAFFYNKSWYQKCQYALAVTINKSTGDSLAKVAPDLLPFVQAGDPNGIITNRDSFRKNQDYSVLFFLLFYALNIVDATVDAHLKDFNVNSDLSFQIKPMILPGATPCAGLTLAFDIHKPRMRSLSAN